MSIAPELPSTHTLLSLAEGHGYKVSKTQLLRWHRVGLLPRPRQHALGKGKGTLSLYPEGTAAQLLLLCELRRRERRISHLAWQLWWAGYPVSLTIIYAHLRAAVVHLLSQVEYFSTLKGSNDLSGRIAGELSDQMLQNIEHITEHRLDYTPLRRVRKRVGKASFSTFVRMLIDIGSGTFTGLTVSIDEHETLVELRILAQGLGLEKLFIQEQANIEHYVANFFIPLLQRLSAWLITYPWENTLTTLTDFKLIQVRDELHTYLLLLQQLVQKHVYDPRSYPSWDANFLDLFARLTVEEQALLIVIWLSLENSPVFI